MVAEERIWTMARVLACVSAVVIVAVTLLLSLAALGGPIFNLSERVAKQLQTNQQYLSQVLPTPGLEPEAKRFR